MKRNRFGSIIFFEYPETYKCPICNSKLYFTCSEKMNIFFVTCENYESCYSPWRKMPNKIPWHIHFRLTDSLEIGSQLAHPAHINQEAETLKCKQADEMLLKIKNENPKIFEEMVLLHTLRYLGLPFEE